MPSGFSPPFVEVGRRAHVVLRQNGAFSDERARSTEIVNPPGGGSEGIWVEPWCVAEGLDVLVDDQPLPHFAIAFARQDGVSTIEHRLRDGLHLTTRVWVPLRLPAVVFELAVANAAAAPAVVPVSCATRLRLSLGWPLGTTEPPHLFATADGVLRAVNSLGQAAIACEPAPAEWAIKGDRVQWQTQLTCPPGASTRLRVVVAAGSRDPSGVARKALRRADDLLRVRIEHYRRCASSAPRLSTPDPTLDRAFAACRPALEDFKHEDPAIGLGYFAGFPAYNFYFAGDAFRMLYGASALGDWSDTREALRTIMRGQRLEDDANGQVAGELWHELSTTGHHISPNFVTLELPSSVLHYVRWSGDVDFAREALPACVRAAEWAARKDIDGDGLPDNGPEQTFADGVREDLNVAGAHVTPAVWQLRAYLALAELYTLLGDNAADASGGDDRAGGALGLGQNDAVQAVAGQGRRAAAAPARTWRRRAARTRRLIESTFWHRTRAGFVETIRPDGVPDTAPGFVPSFEPHDHVEPGLRQDSLHLELDEERALQAGRPGAAASFPPEARQARAYYVMDRGDRARRLLAAGFGEDGTAALRSIARLPFAADQAGFFPEIASRTDEVADPRGCFHQGWTPGYGLAYPVVAGLWGLRPDAVHAALEVAPTPPPDWPEMRLEGVRVGDSELSLTWRRLAEGAELVIACRGATLDVEAWLACLTSARDGRLVLDAGPARARRRRELGCERLGVRLRLASGQAARVAAHWSPPGPSARPRVVRHTASRDGTFARSVRHTAAGDATPEVVYLGFLAPPFEGLALRHVPLNYAARRPEALLDLLPTARAVVLTDQQDAPLPPDLAAAIGRYLTVQGGRLLFFCYWSAAWGRGFFDTYASIAHSPLPELLPLAFRRSPIQTTQRLRLHGPGENLWADLPWPDAPAIDYQPADLRPGAIAWATADPPADARPGAIAWASADPLAGVVASDRARRRPRQVDAASLGPTTPAAGDVLAASWSVGRGRVIAIGLDAFGFGHGTLVHWPGQRPLLRRALDALLRGEQA